MNGLWQDIRYSVRSLAKSPGFSVIAILVLSLGIGVNTAIFSIVNAVFLRPLPVSNPDRLVWIQAFDRARPEPRQAGWMRYSDHRLLQELLDEHFEDIAVLRGDVALIDLGNGRERIRGERVSANYLQVLGIGSALGRTFAADDDKRESIPVAVISHELWRARFAEDLSVLGRRLNISPSSNTSEQGRAYTVIGVAAPGFKGISDPWNPASFWVTGGQRAVDHALICDPPFLADSAGVAIGRLRPMATFDAARAAVAEASSVVEQQNPKESADQAGWHLVATDSRRTSNLYFGGRTPVVPERLAMGLLAIAGILLLIAGTNLAGVLMARGVARRGEIATRVALGAGRGRIVRQVFTESMLIAAAGGLVGVWMSRGLVQGFLALSPNRPGFFSAMRSMDVPVDLRVLAFTVAVCVVVGLFVSFGPARQASRTSLVGLLSGGHATSSRQRSLLRYWIVVPQIAMAVVLLLISGGLVKAAVRSELADLGYQHESVAYVEYQIPEPSRCARQDDSATFQSWIEPRRLVDRRLLDETPTIPSIAGAALLAGSIRSVVDELIRGWVASHESDPQKSVHFWARRGIISPGYFDVLGIPLLGRDFTARDSREAPRVAIVSEALAARLWPGTEAIGQSLTFHEPGKPPSTQSVAVIGVVKDTRPALSDGSIEPKVYTPSAQSSLADTMLLRGKQDPAGLIKDATSLIQQLSPEAYIFGSGSLTGAINDSRQPRRMATSILTTAALIGLLLASIGLYGVVAFSVAQRTREIGIRSALGAQRRNILRLVMSDAVKATLLGSMLGLAAGAAVMKLASTTIVAFPPMDVWTFVAVPLVLALIVFAASYIPARRAARIDPLLALREL
jgi:putative ABC transport system permease protein